MNCSSIFKGNEYGPVRHPEGEELSVMKDRISSALGLDPNSMDSVESFQWIKLHGTKYTADKCYLAIQFDEEDHPVFGELSGIFDLIFPLLCLM